MACFTCFGWSDTTIDALKWADSESSESVRQLESGKWWFEIFVGFYFLVWGGLIFFKMIVEFPTPGR